MADDSDGRLSSLFAGGTFLLAGIVVELGISFVAKLVIAKELGRFDYGVVSLGIITAAILSTLVLLGLNTGIARYLPRYDDSEHRRGVLVSGFQLVVPLAVGVGAALVVGAPLLADLFGDEALVVVFRVFGVAVPFGAVMKLAIGGIQGSKQSLPRVVVRNLTFPLTRFGGIVVALVLGARVVGISLAFLFSYVAAALVGVYYLYRGTSLFDRAVSYVPMRRELLRFSLPLVVTAAMTIVLSDIDMYMLGILRDPGVVGDYNVIYPIAQLLTTALTAFGFLFLPIISELHSDDEIGEVQRLYTVVTKWVVMATLPVFLVMFVFPDRAIALTFGAEYLGGAPALSILSAGFFIHTVFGLNKGALTSISRTRLIMYDDVVGAVGNVLLNLLLIPPFGLVGAAVATTASYGLLNALYSTQLYRETGIHPYSRSLFTPVAIGGVVMAVLTLFAREYLVITPLALVGLFAVFGVAYAVAILRFGIDVEEVKLVLSFEEETGIDLGPLKRVATWFMARDDL